MKNYCKEILTCRLNSYIEYHNSSKLHEKIRKPNFPEDISENIVKLYLLNDCEWKQKSGDLYSEINGKIEVKCFSSRGPISFGPKESWDILFIVDATDFINSKFVIHKINIKSCDFDIKISKSQTFLDQILEKRRPRICWKKLYPQIKDFSSFEKICLANI